jgi:GINS complex subunit 3
MPEALSERVMNALKADPRTLDLRALAPHFYNLSERILELFEEEEMVDVLGDVGGSDLRGWLKHAYWPGWD